MRNFRKYNVDLRGHSAGRVKTYCERCRSTRRNKRDRSLLVDIDKGVCHCFHCGVTFVVPDDDEEDRRRERQQQSRRKEVPQHFRRPVFDVTKLSISERLERWLVEERCLSQEVIRRMKITEQEEWMPQSEKRERCVCFNYFENERLVNTKFRSGSKHFKMVQGAELIPYNIDSVRDAEQIYVTEGEIDALSLLTVGFSAVISVPAGANAGLTYLDRFRESHFGRLRTVIVASDTDEAGLALRENLLTYFGPERCRVATYGEGCKDANEHLQKFGAESLRIVMEQAKEVPLVGACTASDLKSDLRALFENGFSRGAETGWSEMDEICTYERRRLAIVTGIPNCGKSEWVDELVLRLCLRHGWKIGFFSPENVPIVYHLRKLAEKLTGCQFQPSSDMNQGRYDQVVNFLTRNVTHICPDGEATPDVVLNKCRELVVRRECSVFVLDPLNRFDHNARPEQTETQYLSSFLNRLTRFAQRYNCLIILVAHPKKMYRDALTGKSHRPEMYDISGSADFFNKADYGLVVDRDDALGVVHLYVDKVKFKHLGKKGDVTFCYNLSNGRYVPFSEAHPDGKIGQGSPAARSKKVEANWLDEFSEIEQGELMFTGTNDVEGHEKDDVGDHAGDDAGDNAGDNG